MAVSLPPPGADPNERARSLMTKYPGWRVSPPSARRRTWAGKPPTLWLATRTDRDAPGDRTLIEYSAADLESELGKQQPPLSLDLLPFPLDDLSSVEGC